MTSQSSEGHDEAPFTAKQILFLAIASFTIINLGMANGWTAVLPKMQDDPHLFPITSGDVAWLASMTSIVGVFSSLIAGPLTECIGPRRLATASLCLSVGFWMLMAFPPNNLLLYVGRFGLAFNLFLTLVPILPLVAELSPTRIRGKTSSLPEVVGALGLLLGYLLAHLAPWNLATALCALPAAILVVPLAFVPESPYWLVRRGRIEAARASLQRLLGDRSAVEQQLSAITSSSSAIQPSRRQQFTELRKSQNFLPVLLLASLFVLRELGGRNCLMLYSVYIFREAGVELDAFSCTVLLGVARFLSTCVSAAILDRIGRRPLLLTTAAVGGISQGLGGIFLYLQVPSASWVPLVALLVYQVSYGIGFGSVPWVLIGELLPSPVRSVGASIVSTCNSIAILCSTLSFLRIITTIGVGPTFIIYGGITFLTVGITWQWIPETRGVTLQELEVAFAKRRGERETSSEQPIEKGKARCRSDDD